MKNSVREHVMSVVFHIYKVLENLILLFVGKINNNNENNNLQNLSL